MQVPWGLALAEMPTAAFLSSRRGGREIKEHLLGQAQHGVVRYTVPSSLCYGPRILRRDWSSLAQSPFCSWLPEIDNPGRESKRHSMLEFSIRSLSDSQIVYPEAEPGGVADHCLDGAGRPSRAPLGKGPFPVLKPQ